MSRLLTKRWIAVIINTVRSRGGLAQLARALDWQSRGQGFKSPILHHMKTPLKSEPLRFGQQWCFCYKPCIYAGLRAIRFQIQTRQENQKSGKQKQETKKLCNLNPLI